MPNVESEFAIGSRSWEVARKQLRFFDLPDHLKRLSDAGEPLEEMARVIDFEAFRPLLKAALAYSDGGSGGRPPYHPVAKFKAFTLAAQNNVTDARIEFLIRQRLSWLRLRGFDLGEPTPDEHTMWQFREHLTSAGAIQPLFKGFNREARSGDAVHGGAFDGNPPAVKRAIASAYTPPTVPQDHFLSGYSSGPIDSHNWIMFPAHLLAMVPHPRWFGARERWRWGTNRLGKESQPLKYVKQTDPPWNISTSSRVRRFIFSAKRSIRLIS